jgi:hypothetical protein
MTNSRNFTLVSTAAITFVAGILIALFLRQPRTTAHIVISGNPPGASPDPQDIYSKSHDVVNWYAPSGGKIGIEFKAADFDPNSSTNSLKEPPFAGGTPGVDQVINCAGSSCTSLNINPKLESYLHDHQTAHFDYKYWQSLDGNSKDGRIIIKW